MSLWVLTPSSWEAARHLGGVAEYKAKPSKKRAEADSKLRRRKRRHASLKGRAVPEMHGVTTQNPLPP
jgi:uncharacterized protein YdaU (DUF1376 family)